MTDTSQPPKLRKPIKWFRDDWEPPPPSTKKERKVGQSLQLAFDLFEGKQDGSN